MLQWLAAEGRRIQNTVIWSWQGWAAAWASEKSLRQWTLVHGLSSGLACALPLSGGERTLIVALGFLVLAAELGNTAIEEVVDRVSPESSEMARKAKDCGSAMVALAAIAAGAAWIGALLG